MAKKRIRNTIKCWRCKKETPITIVAEHQNLLVCKCFNCDNLITIDKNKL